MQPTVCIDLDGVLTKYHGWQGAEHFGEVIPAGKELCRMLRNDGWKIIIYTCRMNGSWEDEDYEAICISITTWLEENGIEYDWIASQKDGKPFAHAYVDDRAVEWEVNSNDVSTMMHAWKMCQELKLRDDKEVTE